MISGLEDMGYYVDYDQNFDPDDLDLIIHELVGLVINSKIKMTATRIKKGVKLKFIARLGSGLEIIDLEAAKKSGIAVFNSPEGNRNAVAEHAMGMLLSLSNNLRSSDNEVRKKVWDREKNRGFELENKTIGLIGLGNTGLTLASKLSGWGLRVLGYDPYVLEIPPALHYIEKVSMEELQAEADIISLHVQLTPETHHLVDKEFIKNCQKGVIIINTSRGQVVKTKDLIQGLDSGQIGGVCLDVFENEKPHTYTSEEDSMYKSLFMRDNVVLSPHVAGWTDESLFKIAEVLLNKIRSI